MASIKLQGSTSGEITISAPAVAGTNTLTLPAHTGTIMVDGPAFSAYQSSNISITNATFTKVECNVEEFDTNSCYDNATNYRFTPTVAGYYQISGAVSFENGASSITRHLISIFKNGAEFKRGVDSRADGNMATISSLIYLNGSTDYVELYGYATGTSLRFFANSPFAIWFQAHLARAA